MLNTNTRKKLMVFFGFITSLCGAIGSIYDLFMRFFIDHSRMSTKSTDIIMNLPDSSGTYLWLIFFIVLIIVGILFIIKGRLNSKF